MEWEILKEEVAAALIAWPVSILDASFSNDVEKVGTRDGKGRRRSISPLHCTYYEDKASGTNDDE